MNDGRGNDHTSTELAHCNNKSAVHADRREPGSQNRRENTYSAGNENDEEKTNP
jgi:hypothetical protein